MENYFWRKYKESKNEQSQQVEVTLKSDIFYKMTDIGVPKWNRVYF